MTPLSADIGKLILRLTLGLLVLMHGLNKVINGIGGIEDLVQGAGLPAFVAYGVLIGEVLGPVLVLLGWYARVGAVLIAINMLFAIGLAHGHELFAVTKQGAWALELQGMFLFTAVALALMGPGRLAINRK